MRENRKGPGKFAADFVRLLRGHKNRAAASPRSVPSLDAAGLCPAPRAEGSGQIPKIRLKMRGRDTAPGYIL